MKGDPSDFDNQFFSIPKGEVMSLDPQQRLIMENVYQALENGTYYFFHNTHLILGHSHSLSWHSNGSSSRVEYFSIQ